jgi:hypothetical protein
MTSPFSLDVFQKASFIFAVADGTSNRDARGNKKTQGRYIEILFYIRSSGGGRAEQKEVGVIATETYSCYVLEIDGRPAKKLPSEIKPGDVGNGEINGRPCIAKVESVKQSSVVIIPELLGEKTSVTITYKSRGGISG